MTTQVQKALLTGSPDDIRKKLEEISRVLAPQEYSAGERFRALVMELAKHADIQIRVLTYWDESQELEVTLSGDPHCDAIIINRDKRGFNCQVSWEQWLQIEDATSTEKAASLISDILKICARAKN